MTAWTFVVPGEPIAKARPRVVRARGGGVRTFTPERTLAYEEAVRWAARAVGMRQVEQACRVDIVAVWPLPASASKRLHAEVTAAWEAGHPLPRLARPDADNIAKSVLDGLPFVKGRDELAVHVQVAKVIGPRAETHVRVSLLTTLVDVEPWWLRRAA